MSAGPWVTAEFAYYVDRDGSKWLAEVWAQMRELGREFQVAHGAVCDEQIISTIMVGETHEPNAKFPVMVAIPADTTRIALRKIA